ncbi:class F sortase [Actinomycetospora endophytica]|uniref:Class F sortase n=1 Tax=Actinomycetospora endophytica TaxID=2291215 RepID=A0ABS8P8C4_9PSEU|nr:class F sortase [Actinomycetospora endophytica]MCD2194500.1 class F sortase [Actinomycetospora endophytica]
MSTRLETPPRGEIRTGSAANKISIAIVVLLGLIALVVGLSTGTGKSAGGPILLASSAPTRVTVPSINASSSLIPLGLQADGELAVPPLSTPMQASWYDKSPTPGALGPAVVLGHINGDGKPGIFIDLERVKAGDQVLVDRADGQTAVFTVSHVDTVPKANFPSNDVYGDTPDAELRLITCGGVLDKADHNYLSNVIVYANLTEVRKT